MRSIYWTSILAALALGSCELDAVREDGKVDVYQSDTTDNQSMEVVEVVDSLDTTGVRSAKMTFQDDMSIIWDIHGQGNKVDTNGVVFMSYVGRNSRGEEFENTEKFKVPIPYAHGFGMSMKAWDIFLENAYVGDKVRMTVPASLAYGDKGQPKRSPKGGEVEYLVKPGEQVKYQAQIIAQPVPNYVSPNGVKVWLVRRRNDSRPVQGRVQFHYIAYQENGKKFFNTSFENGEPFQVNLDKPNLMPGLVEGLKVLHEGDQALIMVPAKMGYGEKGYLDLVAPGADLLYDIKAIIPQDK